MSYILLTVFWVGVLLLNPVNPGELKTRALNYLGKAKEKTEKIPFAGFIKKIRSSLNKDALSLELAECLAYIKNVVILGGGSSVSTQKLLEELADYSDRLNSAFTSMARYINANEKDRAAEFLGNYIGTSIAEDVGIFLAGWEDLPPEDVLEMVDSYQSSLREERITAQKRKDETISDLIYFPVVINCILILLNFIYVAYFIEQQENLTMLF